MASVISFVVNDEGNFSFLRTHNVHLSTGVNVSTHLHIYVYLYFYHTVYLPFSLGFFCDHDQMYCTYRDQEMCIDSDIRCDGIKNCPDAKDEELCSKPRCFGSCRFSNDVIGKCTFCL